MRDKTWEWKIPGREGVQQNFLWEGTGSRTARTKDGIPTVRKLGAADVAVLDDLPGEKQQRG
jgi:hypothetical protein